MSIQALQENPQDLLWRIIDELKERRADADAETRAYVDRVAYFVWRASRPGRWIPPRLRPWVFARLGRRFLAEFRAAWRSRSFSLTAPADPFLDRLKLQFESVYWRAFEPPFVPYEAIETFGEHWRIGLGQFYRDAERLGRRERKAAAALGRTLPPLQSRRRDPWNFLVGDLGPHAQRERFVSNALECWQRRRPWRWLPQAPRYGLARLFARAAVRDHVLSRERAAKAQSLFAPYRS